MKNLKPQFLLFSLCCIPHFLFAEDSKGGMPQLDPTSYISQLFWLTISFLLIFLIINFYFFPKVREIKSKRDITIKKYISEAEELNVKSSNLENKLDKELLNAKEKAFNLINKTKQVNKEIYEKKLTDFELGLENQMAKNFENLQIEKKKILKNIYDYSTKISNLMYEKILNEKKDLTAQEFENLMKGKIE